MADFFTGLVLDGFLPVFLALVHHLPTVVVLLSVVSLFEHSGLALGFSCTTLAVSNIDKDQPPLYRQRMSRFLTYVPCAAKAPVLLFLLTLVGLHVALVIALYALSIALGILLGGAHVVKCPRLKPRVTIREFFVTLIKNTLEFLKRISVGLVLAVAVLYTLQYLGWLLPMARVIEPLFAPVGFSAALIVALLFGLIAKEMIIGVIISFGVVSLNLTPEMTAGFIVFVLLYTPCLPAMTAIKSKVGWRAAMRIGIGNFIVAYIAAMIVFNVAVLMN